MYDKAIQESLTNNPIQRILNYNYTKIQAITYIKHLHITAASTSFYNENPYLLASDFN